MICKRCGAEMKGAEDRCPACGCIFEEENRVRVLTPEEEMQYDGVTIESTEGGYGGRTERDIRFERSARGKIYRTSFGGKSLTRKLWIGLLVFGIVAFVFFVALPIAVIAALIGLAGWILHRFFGV